MHTMESGIIRVDKNMALDSAHGLGIMGPPFPICVPLDKFLSLCKFLFPHLSIGIIIITPLYGIVVKTKLDNI